MFWKRKKTPFEIAQEAEFAARETAYKARLATLRSQLGPKRQRMVQLAREQAWRAIHEYQQWEHDREAMQLMAQHADLDRQISRLEEELGIPEEKKRHLRVVK